MRSSAMCNKPILPLVFGLIQLIFEQYSFSNYQDEIVDLCEHCATQPLPLSGPFLIRQTTPLGPGDERDVQ